MNLKISLFPMFSLCVVAQEQANKIRKKQGLVAQPRIIETGSELRYAVDCYLGIEDCGDDIYDDIETWNVKQITDMANLFANKKTCNPDISGWDVSQVTNFNAMFYDAWSFDEDISGWDVSSGTDFNGMFFQAKSFDKDISGWDVSSGTNFGLMFSLAESFDNDISRWDVSSGTNFDLMFYGSAMTVTDPKLVFQKAPPTRHPTGAQFKVNRKPFNCHKISAFRLRKKARFCAKTKVMRNCPELCGLCTAANLAATDAPFVVDEKFFTCNIISAFPPEKKANFCKTKVIVNCPKMCGLCTAAHTHSAD